ncbi:MAG: tellurite resistance TerB family protein [Pseudomonadota bacterium]
MSFVKTLATLAAGYAAAKGADKFKDMGGMKGLQDMMSGAGGAGGGENPLGDMMQKMGLPGGDALQGMLGQLTGGSAAAGGAGAAGLGGLMAALGGAQATGQEQASSMMDALTGTTVATDTQEQGAKLMIRAMIQAAKADGEIDEDEKAKILEHMGDMGPEELAFVKAELAAPIDIEGLAADTSDQMKAQVYAVSLMAVKVDHASEARYLNGLADAMGLSPEIRDQVHRSMGIS